MLSAAIVRYFTAQFYFLNCLPLMSSLSLSARGKASPLLKIGSFSMFFPFFRTISAFRYFPPAIFEEMALEFCIASYIIG